MYTECLLTLLDSFSAEKQAGKFPSTPDDKLLTANTRF
jgi:hypothetical protein